MFLFAAIATVIVQDFPLKAQSSTAANLKYKIPVRIGASLLKQGRSFASYSILLMLRNLSQSTVQYAF